MSLKKQFGKLPTKALKKYYSKSVYWKDNEFKNLVETKIDVNIHTLPKMLYKMIFEREGREPNKTIPIESFDKSSFMMPSDEAKFIWFGHSVLLFNINGTIIFIDPMMGPNASPTAPFSTKRFSENTLEILDELPDIDYLILSHDHYDHLDLESIEKLMPKTKHYLVALGVARHLESWNIPVEKITEFDWWQSFDTGNIKITFTPSRHFSGRAIIDKAQSFWGGWVFETPTEKIYFSGDGGYGEHFKEVGKKMGPFDIGFMECGQYNENWHDIHMYPEETVKASIDAKVNSVVPVHWGAFALSQHPWDESVNRFAKEAEQTDITPNYPKLGQCYTIKQVNNERWWKEFNQTHLSKKTTNKNDNYQRNKF